MPDSLFPRPSAALDAAPRLSSLLREHLTALLSSYERRLGRPLIISREPAARLSALWSSPQVLVTHGLGSDPTFLYGNRRALELWEVSWEDFTSMKSRDSAELGEQAERERLLRQVEQDGFIPNYAGIRRSSSGRRFRIEDVTVWEIHDDSGRRLGQAAAFDKWTLL
jgi:hypothetical protein